MVFIYLPDVIWPSTQVTSPVTNIPESARKGQMGLQLPKVLQRYCTYKKSQSLVCELQISMDVLSPVDCGFLAIKGYFEI